MASEKTVQFGVVGCGEIANSMHIPDIVRNPEARLVGTCDRIAERARLTMELWHAKEY